jgi:hypothetical protein
MHQAKELAIFFQFHCCKTQCHNLCIGWAMCHRYATNIYRPHTGYNQTCDSPLVQATANIGQHRMLHNTYVYPNPLSNRVQPIQPRHRNARVGNPNNRPLHPRMEKPSRGFHQICRRLFWWTISPTGTIHIQKLHFLRWLGCNDRQRKTCNVKLPTRLWHS